MKHLIFALLFLFPLCALAQTPPTGNAVMVEKARQAAAAAAYEKKLQNQPLQNKDSIDYTIDDGKMTKEEMQQEAEYMYGLCAQNAYEQLYFDCKCLSGAFLLERERLGPTAMQSDIMLNLTQSENAKCANIESFANESYKSCMNYSKNFRPLANDHEDLCTCAANKAALKFKQKPWLDPSYVGSLNTESLMYCLEPANRTADAAAKKARKEQATKSIKTTN